MNLALLLQASGGSTGIISQVGMIGLIFVIFYFFMIRPQQKKQKDIKTYLETIKKGSTVVTIGGMHGKIVELTDLTMVLEVEKGQRLLFDRSAISMESTKRAYGKDVKEDKEEVKK
jgi:preprotein translocase subunit YajC